MAGLGEQIKNARKAKGMTQTELADKLFISRSAVASWEQDRRIPDIYMLRALSEALEDSSLLAGSDFIAEAQQTASSLDDSQDNGEGDGQQNMPAKGMDPDARPKGVWEDAVGSAQDDLLQQDTPANSAARSNAESASVASQDTTGSAAREIEPTLSFGSAGIPASAPARRKWPWVLACSVLCAALLIILVILPAFRPKETAKPYIDENGELYTIQSMSQVAKNDTGKAYLQINPSLEINRGSSTPYYIYTFKYFETNGIAVSIDRMEVIIFAKGRENLVMTYLSKDILAQPGMNPEISPYGDFVWTGGLPVQDTVYGVGELVHTTDENGAKQIFTSYIPFPDASDSGLSAAADNT